MRESHFHGEIRESLKAYDNTMYIKLGDMPTFGNASRFIPPKPFDIILLASRSILVAIEAKLLKPGKTSISMSQEKDRKRFESQMESLCRIRSLGFRSYLMVNVRGKLRFYGNKKVIKTYCIDPAKAIAWAKSTKPVTLAKIKDASLFELERKEGLWILDRILTT